MTSHRYIRNTQPYTVKRVARRDKERFPIRFAPVKVSRVAWDLDTAKEISFGIDHVDAGGAGAVNVSLDIYFHAVGISRFIAFSLVEQSSVAQGSIGVHIEHANMVAGGVVDVQQTFVWRETQAI